MCSSLSTESDLQPNTHLITRISTALSNSCDTPSFEIDTRSELDSHANMCVFGEDCFVFEWSGRTCSVNPFSDSLGQATDVPICDIAVSYDCMTGEVPETFILIFQNALVIPDMDHNLIPPFILRESGHIVNECPKFQCPKPTLEDHCIVANGDDSTIRIPLQLHGIFSFFHTRLPTNDELIGCSKIFMSPDSDSWNPYCTSFESNERSMTTWQGDMQLHEQRERKLMLTEDDQHFPSAHVSAAALDAHIDNVLEHALSSLDISELNATPCTGYALFAQQVTEIAAMSKMMVGLGGTVSAGHDMSDEFLLASAHASAPSTLSKDFLYRICMFTKEQAQSAIDHNYQLCKHQGENHLSRNYSTNDRMLRYVIDVSRVPSIPTLYLLPPSLLGRILVLNSSYLTKVLLLSIPCEVNRNSTMPFIGFANKLVLLPH